jgi:hypothetical protein
LNGWAKFVRATQLCLKQEITTGDLAEIEKLFREFVIHYERFVMTLYENYFGY